MQHSCPDKQRVYLACRAIFAGSYAQLRKPKKIRELVHAHKSSFPSLIRDYGVEKVLDILKSLLEQGIFQSQVKAKIEFPELFLSSPTRDVQRATSQKDAARSEAEALEEIASLEDVDNEGGGDEVEHVTELAEAIELAPGKFAHRWVEFRKHSMLPRTRRTGP